MTSVDALIWLIGGGRNNILDKIIKILYILDIPYLLCSTTYIHCNTN